MARASGSEGVTKAHRRPDELQSLLYGIEKSNRKPDEMFGKNQFNSAFPVALACYMRDKGHNAVYLKLNQDLEVEATEISLDDVFNTTAPTHELYFDFEAKFSPYEVYAHQGEIDEIDLVVKHEGSFLRALEIKLTVLPDNPTSKRPEREWGSELVIRPATTSYAALQMFDSCKDSKSEIHDIFDPVCSGIYGWDNPVEIDSKLNDFKNSINIFQSRYYAHQKPFLMQPIWKTQGKRSVLADNAFDLFIWSDFALCRTFLDRPKPSKPGDKTPNVSRYGRSTARLARIIYELTKGKVRLKDIYRQMDFGWQTDKEFALPGRITREYMQTQRRITPMLKKEVLRDIILHGSQSKLSPERRFDQTVYFTTESLFKDA